VRDGTASGTEWSVGIGLEIGFVHVGEEKEKGARWRDLRGRSADGAVNGAYSTHLTKKKSRLILARPPRRSI
jgi:hypothetical protein